MRRLRPRFDQRRADPGLLTSSTSSRYRVAKLSGIGCSSKTPDYFLGNATASTRVHGRMPSVLTGANLANRDLIYLGVSGDGDSASIGLGQFAHCVRRGVNMVYICENNGVYGLTKGQFSATADKGSQVQGRRLQHGQPDRSGQSLALVLGATFVARSFSGDKKQLVPIIKAAIAHQGSAVIDVISPCVQFNNHAGSTKSFDFVREHNEAVNRLDFIVDREEITADYEPGTVQMVQQHDGSYPQALQAACRLRSDRPRRGDGLSPASPQQGRSADRPALCRGTEPTTCTPI